MKSVNIRKHSRRGKNGKSIQVRRYLRRVGKKGFRSPKREKVKPGDEFINRVTEQPSVDQPSITPEEIAERKRIADWEASFERAERERKSHGMTREQYSAYLLREAKKQVAPKKTLVDTPRKSSKKRSGFLENLEDNLAKFVEKYSNKKYKRQL